MAISLQFLCLENMFKINRSIQGVFAGLPATLLKKRLRHRCFPMNFAKFSRIPFLQNNPGRLLLNSAENYFKFTVNTRKTALMR